LNGLPTGRVISSLLALSAMLADCGEVFAADPVGAVAPAHGPMLMLYVSQPLFRGASRVYGLRLEQTAPTAWQLNPQNSASGFSANSPQRSLVDLQIRHRSDVRLAFGNRVAWNWGRREFEFPNARAQKPIDFIATAH
jgi:hypothetical protein